MIRTCAVLLLALLLSPLSAQTTLSVPSSAHPTIQSAATAAVDGDTILVAAGTYLENIDLLGKNVTLRGSAAATCVLDGRRLGPVLRQVGAPTGTLIEGFTIRNGFAPRGGGLHAERTDVHLLRCSFTDNAAGFDGGAVHLGGAYPSPLRRLTIEDCDFANNTAGNDGGAICVSDADVTIDGSAFARNHAGARGGAVFWFGDDGLITGATFDDNRATVSGGAVEARGVDLIVRDSEATGNAVHGGTVGQVDGGAFSVVSFFATFERCRMLSNTALGTDPTWSEVRGGAISSRSIDFTLDDSEIRGNFVSAGSPTGYALSLGGGVFSESSNSVSEIRRCVIAENRTIAAGATGGGCLGGGLTVYGGSLRAESLIVHGNVASYQGTASLAGGAFGGGIYPQLTATVQGCTIVGNSATHGGGGLIGALVVTNSIVRGNTPNQLLTGGVVQFSNVQGGWVGTGNIDIDPQFVDAANGDLHLAVTSPCIDAGGTPSAAPIPGIDIDGEPRPLDGGPDIGADEVPFSPFLDPACAAGTVALDFANGPIDTLTIGGSSGGAARRVVLPLAQSFTIDVAQPPTTGVPAAFYIAGYVGMPGAAQVTPLPQDVGTLCIPLPFLTPGAPGSFVLTSSFGPDPTELVPSTPTPWSHPVAALFFPLVMTLQGVIQETPTTLRTTNAILIDIR